MHKSIILLFCFILMFTNAFAIEPSLMSGRWEAKTKKENIKFTLNETIKNGEKVKVVINNKAYEMDFSYGYANDGIYPLLTFHLEKAEVNANYEDRYIYLVPGLVDGRQVLVGFYERSEMENLQKETIRSTSEFLMFKKTRK